MATFMDNIRNSGLKIPELTKEEKFKCLEKLGNDTFDEVVNMLCKTGKSMLVRPTGFGKTRLMVRLAKKYAKDIPDKNILYIYPLNIIKTEIFRNKKYTFDGILKSRVEFISYQELTLKYNKFGASYWFDLLKDKYSLIILDEVHRAGADGFMNIYSSIIDLIGPQGIHIAGGTATARRMEDTEDDNITTNIFEGNEISTLTLEDLIVMGVMKPPLYAKSMYNNDELLRLLSGKLSKGSKYKEDSLDNSGIQLLLSRQLKDILGAEEFIINSLEQADYNLRKETYFKFIVFFNDIADVNDRGPIVERWFNDAFNIILKERYGLRAKYKIRPCYVTSSDPSGELSKLANEDENRNYFNKTDKLNDIDKENRTIDLIMTVNMINMGYHVEDITGIVMLRGTKSEIVYYQQIGRCLSVLSMNRPIIFDFVQNYTEVYDHKFKEIIKGSTYNESINTGATERNDTRDLILEYSNIEGLDSAIKLVNEENPELVDRILWLYNEKLAPLCVIASETGQSLYNIKKILDKYKMEIRQENSMISFIQDYSDKNTSLKDLIPFIYSNAIKKILKEKDKLMDSIFTLFSDKL